MKLSARNQIEGTVKEISTGVITAKVVLDIGGNEIVSVITKDSVEELGLAVGDKAIAVIKSTEVMIMK